MYFSFNSCPHGLCLFCFVFSGCNDLVQFTILLLLQVRRFREREVGGKEKWGKSFKRASNHQTATVEATNYVLAVRRRTPLSLSHFHLTASSHSLSFSRGKMRHLKFQTTSSPLAIAAKERNAVQCYVLNMLTVNI